MAIIAIILFFIGYAVGERSVRKAQEWRQQYNTVKPDAVFMRTFIEKFRSKATSKNAKELLDAMLAEVDNQAIEPVQNQSLQPLNSMAPTSLQPQQLQQPSQPQAVAPLATNGQTLIKTKEPIDNTSLLLYFGAFLFIASMGLFVGFSDVSGSIKTFFVAITAAALYVGGLYLHDQYKRFAQVGIAFVGIGMAVAPLVGLALYSYVFDQSNGAATWFVTSIVVFALYFHALMQLKNTIVSYLLIFSFVSLFQSAVSVIDAPVYYFAWALALAGMVLQIVSLKVKGWEEIKGSASDSSLVLIALTLLVSFFMVQGHGVGQLCVSLGLATIFFALEYVSHENRKAENAVATQVLATATIACGAYAAANEFGAVVWALVAVVALESAVIAGVSLKNKLALNFGGVAVITAVIALFFSAVETDVLVPALLAIVLSAGLLALRWRIVESFVVAVVAWAALPIVYGQVVVANDLSSHEQAIISFMGMLPIALITVALYGQRKNKDMLEAAKVMFLLVASLVLVVSATGDALLVLYTSLAMSVLFIGATMQTKDAIWVVAAGVSALVPLLYGLTDFTNQYFFMATVIGLLVNVALALYYKNEESRWFSTMAWLVIPVAVGQSLFAADFPARGYAWLYVAVLAVLILSRVIARGRIMLSSKALMSSLTKGASIAYVYGAIAAGAAAITLSIASEDAVDATLIMGIVGGSLTWLAAVIEKDKNAGYMLPITLQSMVAVAFLLQDGRADQGATFALVSIVIAVTGYALGSYSEMKSNFTKQVAEASVVSAYIAPVVGYYVSGTTEIIHPISLFLAGAVSLDFARNYTQEGKELAGGAMLAAIWWGMHYFGVENPQAYSHVLAILFAGYAYWRAIRGDKAGSDNYVYAALATVTLPLLAQALDADSGGLYGIWLMVEMIGFMLLGSIIGNRTITLWGLYVAVGSVLYQLRDLGWAMLAVLAVFVIGIAIYQTSKQDKD